MTYKSIYKSYEEQYHQYGDSFKGVGWLRQEDCNKRFKVMSEIFYPNEENIKILDFGCGLSHFYEYLSNNKDLNGIEYLGLDISQEYIEASKKKFPNNKYYCKDILEGDFDFDFDYAVINGVFTQKFSMNDVEMFAFLSSIVEILYNASRKGVAFNVMSNYVDFKKDGAFHLSFEKLSNFIIDNLTKNFVIRHDYGLYEYTVYIYK
jgi:SAM-dependent methyltransferase